MKKLSNKEIIKLLKEAKLICIDGVKHNYSVGICYCISHAYLKIYNKDILYINIKYIIPKFNKKFFNISNNYSYWWRLNENGFKSRIRALDKLIDYYSCNNIISKIMFYIKWYFK